MREIHLNGYIDDEEWFGDEITPDALHALLYPPDAEDPDSHDDLRIILNSYGGSCNAAVRMFDELRAYPANVHIIVSGTAASAATVLATAADRLEMTQGSLWMIHDPSVAAWGNERDLAEAIQLLRACKESILNVYSRRCRKPREEIGAMMRDTTWLDASAALQDGFIDGIVDMGSGIVNAAFSHETSLAEAKEKVAVWLERSRPKCIRAVARQKDASEPEEPAAEQLEATKPQIEIIVAQEAPPTGRVGAGSSPGTAACKPWCARCPASAAAGTHYIKQTIRPKEEEMYEQDSRNARKARTDLGQGQGVPQGA